MVHGNSVKLVLAAAVSKLYLGFLELRSRTQPCKKREREKKKKERLTLGHGLKTQIWSVLVANAGRVASAAAHIGANTTPGEDTLYMPSWPTSSQGRGPGRGLRAMWQQTRAGTMAPAHFFAFCSVQSSSKTVRWHHCAPHA